MIQSIRQFAQPHNVVFQLLVASGCGLLLGLACLWVPPLWITIGLIGLYGAIVALKRPELMLLGYLVIRATIFSPDQDPSVSLGFGRIYLTDVMLMVPLGLTFLRWMTEREFKFVSTPLDMPFILLFVTALMSAANVVMSGALPFKMTLEELRIVSSYLFFFAVTNVMRERRQLTFLVHGTMVLATFVSVAMIVQYAVGNSVQILPGRVEALSTEGKNFSGITRILPPGQSLVMMGFVCLSIMLIVEPFKPTHIWLFVQWGLSSVALLMTFNRNFWVAAGLAIVMAIGMINQKERKRLFVWGGVVSVLAVVLIVMVSNLPNSKASALIQASADRLFSLVDSKTFESQESSLRWRDFEYFYAFRQIAVHPLLGVGPGADYRPWVPGMDHDIYDGRDYIHNGHVWIMVKMGLPAYACVVWFSLVFFYRSFVHWRAVDDPAFRSCVLGFPLVYIGVLLGSIVNPMLMQEFWTPIVGMMMGINEIILKSYAGMSGSPNRMPSYPA